MKEKDADKEKLEKQQIQLKQQLKENSSREEQYRFEKKEIE